MYLTKASVTLRQFEAGRSVKPQHLTETWGHTVFFFFAAHDCRGLTHLSTSQNHQENSMTTRIPTETGLLLIIQKNCRTKFSNFSLIFDYKKTKGTTIVGPRVHDRCCFFPNLKPFSVVVSLIRQEKSASQLCFS